MSLPTFVPMSITASQITKLYGSQKALDNVSFTIGTGEVVGFLGPNGAGKSTMMKILTCFLPPTEGSATVCGFDTRTASMDVRRNVGYLPEHNPLYLDLYVREYLDFVAGLHGLKDRTQRVNAMVERVGLGREQHKRIGQLSKGYRQRVGLAQAMIHDPKVLILDEPTSGLDPNQLEEIRALIRHLGQERTVMLSTHIMQEVEAICDRVIIINKGRIVADDDAKHIRGLGGSRQAVLVEFDGRARAEDLQGLPGVLHVERGEGNAWTLTYDAEHDIRPTLFQFAVDKGLTVLTQQRVERDLESVFKELTTGLGTEK